MNIHGDDPLAKMIQLVGWEPELNHKSVDPGQDLEYYTILERRKKKYCNQE